MATIEKLTIQFEGKGAPKLTGQLNSLSAAMNRLAARQVEVTKSTKRASKATDSYNQRLTKNGRNVKGITGAFGKQGRGIPGFAEGGSVGGGKPIVVGEKGPEIFTPGKSGYITPNHALGGTSNVTINVDAGGSSMQGDAEQAGQLGRMLAAAVQDEMARQKRPGGILY